MWTRGVPIFESAHEILNCDNLKCLKAADQDYLLLPFGFNILLKEFGLTDGMWKPERREV